MSPPMMKARYLKSTVAAVGTLAPAAVQQIRLVAKPTIATIEAAAPVEWVSMALDVELTHAVAEVMGRDGVVTVNRTGLRLAMRTPLLRPIVEGARRLFGFTPAALLHVCPRAYAAVTRNAGQMSVKKLDLRDYLVTFEDLPELFAADDEYLAGYDGLAQGVVDAFDLEPIVENTRIDATRVQYRIQWRDRA